MLGTAWGIDYANLPTDDYLGPAHIAATVEHMQVFTEGPVANAAGDIYFTNVPANQILKFEVSSRRLSVFRENSNAANGLAFDAAGRLLACEGGTDDQGRVTRTDLATGKTEVLADAFAGKPLGAPNDLCLDRTGRIYFTSRSSNPATANVNSVYRIDLNGELSQVLAAPDIDMPNGIEISPDNQWLYLIESDGRLNRSRCIKRYPLKADGSVGAVEVWFDFSPGRSGDGLCLDAEGNLYVAAGLHKTRGTSETLATQPGIHVISPRGQLVGFIKTPVDTITNCAFGGADRRTLYVTCGPYLLELSAKQQGVIPPVLK